MLFFVYYYQKSEGKRWVQFFENQNQGARAIVALPLKIEDREDGQLLFFFRKSKEEFRGRMQKESEEEEIRGRRWMSNFFLWFHRVREKKVLVF